MENMMDFEQAEIERLAARVTELEAALRPFADAIQGIHFMEANLDPIWTEVISYEEGTVISITAGDIRRAAAALGEGE